VHNPVDVLPTRLFTTWGTVLYVDGVSGELRHGPIGSSPANAVFAPELPVSAGGAVGRLAYDRSGACEPLFCHDGRLLTAFASAGKAGGATPTQLQLMPLERGLIALKAGGIYLCADPDGRITLSRSACSLWECFLASEDWCTDPAIIGEPPASNGSAMPIDWHNIIRCNIDPLLRVRVKAGSRLTKVLFYGYTRRSHGRLYYDLCKRLTRRRYIADILDWQIDHSGSIDKLIPYYDLFITSLDGIHTLTDIYKVPLEKIVALAHSEADLQTFIEQQGLAPFAGFGAYGVVSYSLLFSSLTLGITRIPVILPLGIDFAGFYAQPAQRLSTIGYASTITVVSKYGIELKREELARECAEEAGLGYKRSASPQSYLRFLDMAEFYESVDAVLIPSLQEGAGLPAMEAAAAGRLVISTPVGHFPVKAYQGGGIIAPLDGKQFRKFVVEKLHYYKADPERFASKCREIQGAARKFDWEYVINDWIELIDSVR
jgi:glycosyltransferase involved in cell wall biosynthesis